MANEVILRRWTGRIRSADEQAYIRYIEGTGLAEYRATPGNLGCQMLMRALDGGVTEVSTLSWWRSMDAVRAFAGPDAEIPVYYPEDDRFLLERTDRVEHHRVVAGSGTTA